MCKAKSMSRTKPILRMAFCGTESGLLRAEVGGDAGATIPSLCRACPMTCPIRPMNDKDQALRITAVFRPIWPRQRQTLHSEWSFALLAAGTNTDRPFHGQPDPFQSGHRSVQKHKSCLEAAKTKFIRADL